MNWRIKKGLFSPSSPSSTCYLQLGHGSNRSRKETQTSLSLVNLLLLLREREEKLNYRKTKTRFTGKDVKLDDILKFLFFLVSTNIHLLKLETKKSQDTKKYSMNMSRLSQCFRSRTFLQELQICTDLFVCAFLNKTLIIAK